MCNIARLKKYRFPYLNIEKRNVMEKSLNEMPKNNNLKHSVSGLHR